MISDAVAELKIKLWQDYRCFQRGEHEGKRVITSYDAVMDKTLVITEQSHDYILALTALDTLEKIGQRLMPRAIQPTGIPYEHHVLI